MEISNTTVENSLKSHKNAKKSISIQEENLILKEIRVWCETSTSHGIPKIIRSKTKFQKLLWLIVFLSSTSYCIYALYADFQNYFKYRVLTYVNTVYDMPVILPAISICGTNNNINETLNSCLIKRGRLQTLKCSSLDFKNSIVPGYENCFSFNSGLNANNIKQQLILINETGEQNGIMLEFKTMENHSFYQGFVHHQEVSAINEQNIKLKPKAFVKIGLKRVRMKKLSKPYSDCNENNRKFPGETAIYFSEIINSSRYSQKICYTLCMKHYLNKYCINAYSNVTKLYNSFKCTELDNILKICSKNCPVECDSLYFSPTILSKIHQKEDKLAILQVYYEEMQYMSINEVPAVTSESFIGNIG